MKKKAKTTKAGVVRKVIKHVDQPEKVEITIPAADYLYQEIRIENKLEDDKGKEVKLKQGDNVDVTIEADKIEADKNDAHHDDKGSRKKH